MKHIKIEADFVNSDSTGISTNYIRVNDKLFWCSDAKELADYLNSLLERE